MAPSEHFEPSSPLVGKRVVLRPVQPSDAEYLYREEVSGRLAFRWRLGGVHPDPQAYAESLWNGVLVSFLALDTAQEKRLGIFTAYGADFRNQFVFAGAALQSEASASPFVRASTAAEATELLLEYLFGGFPFRKVYMEVGEYNLPQFESMVGRLAAEEGRLKAHLFYDWNWWDLVTLAIWRDTWEASPYRRAVL